MHTKNISSFAGCQFYAAKRNTASVFMCSGMFLQRMGVRAFGVLILSHACNSWMTVFYILTWFSVAAEIPLFGDQNRCRHQISKSTILYSLVAQKCITLFSHFPLLISPKKSMLLVCRKTQFSKIPAKAEAKLSFTLRDLPQS